MNVRRATYALVVVTVVGALVRLAMLDTLPLLVTADSLFYPEGRGYLVWAQEILARGDFAGPQFRTPGYPTLLAGAFAIGGVRDQAVLVLQHLAGLATVAMITAAASKLGGPRAALVTGVLAALDPWHLLFAHYALTESSMVLLVVSSVAAVLLPSSRSFAQGVTVGILAGATCLIRPSGQMWAPFVVAAYLLRGPLSRSKLVAASAAAVLGLTLSLGPWLAFNASRGIRGLAVPSEGPLFTPLLLYGLLDARDMPPDTPEPVRRAFAEGDAERADARFIARFQGVCAQSGLSYEQRQAWSRRSLVRNLHRYPSAAWDTLRTLLGVGRPNHPPIPDELLRFVVSLTTEARGSTLLSHRLPDAFPTPPPLLPAPVGEVVRGGLVRAFELASSRRGVPQVPLAFLAGAAVALCAWRRRFAEAAALGGSLAFVAGHALILYPNQRFALPSEMLWYLALPLLWGILASRPGTARATP